MELAEVGQDRSQNTKQASTHLLLARDDRGRLTSRATIADFSVLLSRLLAAGNHHATGALDVTRGARCLRLGLLRRPLIDRDAARNLALLARKKGRLRGLPLGQALRVPGQALRVDGGDVVGVRGGVRVEVLHQQQR